MKKQKAALPPAKKWLRRLGILLAAVVGVPLLLVLSLPLALSLRPAPKTVRLVQTVDLPGHGLVAFADYLTLSGPNVYAGETSQDKLAVIDTRTGRVTATVGGLAGIHGFAADPQDHLGFTSDGGENMVGVIDLNTNRLLSKVPGGVGPDAIIFDPKDNLVYAVDHAGRTATLIDPVARRPVATIALGGVAEFAEADPATGYIYQNLEDTDETVVVDPNRRSVIARYKTAPGEGPTGLALDSADRRVFVVCGNNILVVLDETDGHQVASLPIGSGVDGVGYDPGLKRVYTANGFGTMTVIQQDTVDRYHVLENAPTPFGGHALAVDPATHRVYVVCAGLGTAKIAVFEPAP